MVTAGLSSRQGQIWRSPLPDANGDGITWTRIFDLADFTTTAAGSVPGGEGSYFREQSLAIDPDGLRALVLEYGAVVTGGPSVYYTANIEAASMLWTKRHTFANAKHGHGVARLGDLWFVMLGDAGFSDLGLWRAPSPGTPWSRSSLYGDANGGNTRYGINIHPTTLNGVPVIISDDDTKQHASILLFGGQGTQALPLLPYISAPIPFGLGTVRQVTITGEGNVYWVQTGENGAVSPVDSIWVCRLDDPAHPVMLESKASDTSWGTLGASVESGDYIFLGSNRVRKEKFIGQ